MIPKHDRYALEKREAGREAFWTRQAVFADWSDRDNWFLYGSPSWVWLSPEGHRLAHITKRLAGFFVTVHSGRIHITSDAWPVTREGLRDAQAWAEMAHEVITKIQPDAANGGTR